MNIMQMKKHCTCNRNYPPLHAFIQTTTFIRPEPPEPNNNSQNAIDCMQQLIRSSSPTKT